MSNQNNFYDAGEVTLTTSFAYGEVSKDLGEPIEQTERNLEDLVEINRRIWQWVYQPPCKDLDGFNCRCIVASWIFVPEIRSESMTYIAGRFGKKKQSIGRWVADFKTQFPEVANHLQHIRHNNE